MSTLKRLCLSVAGLVLAAGASAQGVRPIPATPAAVETMLAVPFTLRNGYRSDWSLERPLVTSGHLLVLRVQPDLVYPRQTAEPVLYAGNHVAEKLNVGYRSGIIVAIVPGALDLARDPVWFGAPKLPEQVSLNDIRAERVRALGAGIRPAAATAQAVRADWADKEAALRFASQLIRQYAPDEAELADGLVALPR